MLDTKRIIEAQKNTTTYLREGMLKKETNNTAKNMFLKNSDLSLETAQRLLVLEKEGFKSYLWVVVTSYYSMYYIANAVLLTLGYKVGDKVSHKVTSDALITYVRDKLHKELIEGYEDSQEDALELVATRTDSLIKSFDFERGKRSKFQYDTSEEIQRKKAITSLTRAKEFVFELKKLL